MFFSSFLIGGLLYGVRFLRQKDQYSCGPVAVINALKWAGLPLTYKSDFKEIKTRCKTTADWGTTPHNISKVLSQYDELSFEIKQLITLKDIEEHLLSGGAVILEYWFKDETLYDGHYVFIYEREGNDFVVVNHMSDGSAVQVCSRQNLKSMLRCKKYRYTGSPSAWLIRKVSKDEDG